MDLVPSAITHPSAGMMMVKQDPKEGSEEARFAFPLMIWGNLGHGLYI
jgi:hypothetical protein